MKHTVFAMFVNKKRSYEDSQSDNDLCVNNTCSDPYAHKVIDYQRGDIICSGCGCTQPGQMIAEQEDKRNFMEDGKDHRRTQLVDPVFGFSTTYIENKSKKSRFLQQINAQLVSREDRSDIKSLQSIHTNLEFLSKQWGDQISTISFNTAKSIGKQLLKNLQKAKKIIRGLRSIECAVALLYFATQIHNDGVPLKGLKTFSSKEDGKVINAKKVKNFIKIVKEYVKMQNLSSNPKDMIRCILANLQQPIQLENKAVSIYELWTKEISPM